MQLKNRGVAAPPAAKLLTAQKLAKMRHTLSRLLRRFPAADQPSAPGAVA